LCDAQRFAAWLPSARLHGSRVELRGSGLRLAASISRPTAHGTVTLADGTRHAFSARLAPAQGAAGLYRAVKTVRGHKWVGGWVLLSARVQRGYILRFVNQNSFGLRAPKLDPVQPSVQVTEGSVATVVKLGE